VTPEPAVRREESGQRGSLILFSRSTYQVDRSSVTIATMSAGPTTPKQSKMSATSLMVRLKEKNISL